MEREALYDLTMQALAAAFNRDATGAADALAEIGEHGGSSAVYGACSAFAEVGRQALIKFYGGKSADLSRGDMWALEQIGGGTDPHELFAVRFLVAYANDDKDQAMALFSASIDGGPDAHVGSVVALLGTVVHLTEGATGQAVSRD